MLSRKQIELGLPWAIGAITAVIIWLLLSANFVLYQVEGESMEPALFSGDRVLIGRQVDIRRGDIIAIHEKNGIILKRVIGMPGETLDFSQQKIRIANDNSPTGDIWTSDAVTEGDWSFAPLSLTLGPEEWYVLGDKRGQSLDSRHFGPVNTRDIIGGVVLRYAH